MSLAPPAIRTPPSLGFPIEQAYTICSLTRSSTSPVVHPTSPSARSRTHQLVGHLLRSNTTVHPEHQQTSRDAATLKPRGSQNNKTVAMTTRKEAEADACPTCKRKYSDSPDEKPTKAAKKDTTVDIDGHIEDKFNQLPPLPSPAPVAHRDFVHCMPPEAPTYRDFSVFLAGSIEMGKAVQWQKHMANFLSPLPITVNNPRRGHWDPAATQEAKNESFRHQVEWELSALEKADVICFFLDVNTMSPVTMLELGLWAHSKKVVVCCDKRFWRAGNIHIVCDRYGIPFVESFEELVPAIKNMLVEKGMKLDENGDLVK